MIKNKRGEEEEGLSANTMGTVLALTATLIIIAFIYVAITQVIRDNELEAAQSVADRIKTKIDIMEVGQSNNFSFQGNKDLAKNGWHILGWSKEDIGKPDKCILLKGCICICKGKTTGDCQAKGICRELETKNINISYFDYLEAEWGSATVGSSGRTTKIRDAGIKIDSYIAIPSNFFVLEIRKTSENITIYDFSPEYLQQFGRK